MSEAPEEVRRLAERRAEARSRAEYAEADALRERIRGLGWDVADGPDGFDLRPAAAPKPPPRVRAERVASVLGEPPTHDATVHWLAEGWPEDVLRGIRSFRRAEGSRRVQHVVVEAVPAAPDLWPEDVEVVRLTADPGFGRARNAGLRRSRGRIVLVADGSLEATGDVFGPLEEALGDPGVGVCGPFGVVTRDLRSFEAAEGPEVDAVEGYLMALRRRLLDWVAFDGGFRFYRAADIDLCFQVKALGYRALRLALPVRRHEHRRWATTDPEERWRLSRRNFHRFLHRFGSRADLLVGGG